MHAAASAAGRGRTQVLKRTAVLLQRGRLGARGKDVEERQDPHESIVRHFAARQDSWKILLQSIDEQLRSFVHVRLGVIFPASRDIQKIRVGVIGLDGLRDARGQPVSPGLHA